MKIVKEGKWNAVWSKEYACDTCEAVLLIEEDDVKPVDNSTGFYFVCPICAKRTYLDAKDMTLRVREAVEKKRKYWSSGDW